MPSLRTTSLFAALLSMVMSACAPDGGGAADDTEGCATACNPDDGSTSASMDAVDESGEAPDAGDESGSASAPEIPCDIQQILRDNCGDCHGDPPRYGAPMPLVDYDDFQVPAESSVARSVWEVTIDRLGDPVSPMPPGGDMDPDDRDDLLAWLEAGAPQTESDQECEMDPEDPGEPVGPDALPCTPSHTFIAHAEDSKEPFHVPAQGADNLYQCFSFHSPLAEGTQATAWAPIIDDERVVHHWILYRTPTPQPDGGVGPCNMPNDTTFVAGWAPGGKNFLMPDDVGLELGGPDDYYILQIHYHNTAQYDDSFDRSGVAFCTAEQPRPMTAGVLTLGTIWLNIPAGAEGHQESGVCPSWITSLLPEPLTVIASFPHMHEIGRSFSTEILRGGDEADVEPVTEVPIYEFDNQEFYVRDEPIQIMPGDAIRTTCTYDNPYDFPVRFGEGTEDEMCFNFVMAYPIENVGDSRNCGTWDNG
ncbi:MAG: hypothetical protein AAGF11_11740 [Myxococcota bacterium]